MLSPPITINIDDGLAAAVWHKGEDAETDLFGDAMVTSVVGVAETL